VRNQLVLLIATGTALAACSATPAPNQNLDAAATLYNQASNDPLVVKHAPLELQQSREALAQSQNVWQSNGDRQIVDHYAYIAARRAELAQQTAKLKEAQAQVSNADATRAQSLLAARTAESAHARNEAAQLKQQLEALKTNQANAGIVLTLRDILFDVNGTELKPGAYDSVRQIAAYLKQHPERTVTVEGFTDSTGSPDYNMRLSQLRAETVRNELVREGVAPERVIARGMGPSVPVASNDTTAGRQLNRRVQIAVSDSAGRMPAETPALSGGTTLPTR
jgi:outer membrane protein OmpA-like peptidoglycan-associated protein